MSCLATPLRFLKLSPRELNLAAVCASGQSFRWAKGPLHATLPDGDEAALPQPGKDTEEWAFGWNDRTVVLRQDDQGLYYRSLYPHAPPHTAFLADLSSDTTLAFVRRYFQLDVPLAPLYDQWAAGDPKFRRKVEGAGEALQGIRVLAQDEWETLVSFICSANNNIARITLMVNRLCASLGSPLPHPTHFAPSTVHSYPSSVSSAPPPTPPPNDLSFFAFPPPSALTASSTEPLLRQLGFGYRASFIPSTASLLLSLASAASAASAAPSSPEAYLRALRKDEFTKAGRGGIREARELLVQFKGVGRKVADCVLLFGLGWAETVPVDTHVFQIAIRDYAFPSSKSTSLTPLLHDRILEHLSRRWGPYAGWCQQVLFYADLSPAGGSPTKKGAKVEGYTRIEFEEEVEEGENGEGEVKKRKLTFEEEVAALIATPGAKRSRRSAVMTTETVKVEVEVEVAVEGEGLSGSELSELESEEEEKPRKKRGSAKGRKAGGGGRKKAAAVVNGEE
ncbi:hypothetical protein JCM6882_009541 [Rhodosporidiobolus microsporus]